jgi:hypothetical protein
MLVLLCRLRLGRAELGGGCAWAGAADDEDDVGQRQGQGQGQGGTGGGPPRVLPPNTRSRFACATHSSFRAAYGTCNFFSRGWVSPMPGATLLLPPAVREGREGGREGVAWIAAHAGSCTTGIAASSGIS